MNPLAEHPLAEHPLANKTFADSAGLATLTTGQQYLASLPALSELPPGSPMLGSRYAHAVLVTTYAAGGRFWAGLLARSHTGRIVALRSDHDLKGAQSPLEARQRVVAAHATNLAASPQPQDEATTPIWWLNAAPTGAGLFTEATRDILAFLSPDPTRFHEAFRVAQLLLAAGVGAPLVACALALVGADPLPSDVPLEIIEHLRSAGPKTTYDYSKRTLNSPGQPLRIDLRSAPASGWFAGLEQGSPTNPLLRVLVEYATRYPLMASAVTIITRAGESRHFDLALDPEQPHGTFTCRPVAVPSVTLTPAITLTPASKGARP